MSRYLKNEEAMAALGRSVKEIKMGTYRLRKLQIHSFLTSSLNGDE